MVGESVMQDTANHHTANRDAANRHNAKRRRAMVDGQVRTFDVTDRAVIDAMYDVPRDVFVAPELAELAYSESSMTWPGSTRTLLKPMVLGRMLQALKIVDGERVLDVAGGTGYGAAILAAMGARITLLEEDAQLAALAAQTLGLLGVAGVNVVQGPLAEGAKAAEPFDAILVEGVVETGIETLLAQLTPEGRLMTLTGAPGETVRAMLYRRSGETIGHRRVFDAAGPWLESFARPLAFVL